MQYISRDRERKNERQKEMVISVLINISSKSLFWRIIITVEKNLFTYDILLKVRKDEESCNINWLHSP